MNALSIAVYLLSLKPAERQTRQALAATDVRMRAGEMVARL